MTQDELKKAVGWAALQYVQPGTIVGVGTGSTAAHFIDALGTMKGQIEGAVSSSDASKQVDILGKFPLPVEVIPMARSAVARQLVKLGGRPEYRQGVVTDNGNVILDVHGLEILDAIALENAINGIPGVVTVGLFANRGADVALIGTADGVKTIVK